MIAAFIALACSSSTTNDNAGEQMSLGISETRSGLSRTETGVAQVKDNSRGLGISNIDSGMMTMNQGMADMHSGMDMMASGMTMHCMDGGSAGMMDSIQLAMDQMHRGQLMLASGAAADDADALVCLDNGQRMMAAALEQAQSSMSCMGHGGMMPDGMM
jgi:uncharacterized phage infection (PIP) family protein YhgE